MQKHNRESDTGKVAGGECGTLQGSYRQNDRFGERTSQMTPFKWQASSYELAAYELAAYELAAYELAD